jgi:hypothetical protein
MAMVRMPVVLSVATAGVALDRSFFFFFYEACGIESPDCCDCQSSISSK